MGPLELQFANGLTQASHNICLKQTMTEMVHLRHSLDGGSITLQEGRLAVVQRGNIQFNILIWEEITK